MSYRVIHAALTVALFHLACGVIFLILIWPLQFACAMFVGLLIVLIAMPCWYAAEAILMKWGPKRMNTQEKE